MTLVYFTGCHLHTGRIQKARAASDQQGQTAYGKDDSLDTNFQQGQTVYGKYDSLDTSFQQGQTVYGKYDRLDTSFQQGQTAYGNDDSLGTGFYQGQTVYGNDDSLGTARLLSRTNVCDVKKAYTTSLISSFWQLSAADSMHQGRL